MDQIVFTLRPYGPYVLHKIQQTWRSLKPKASASLLSAAVGGSGKICKAASFFEISSPKAQLRCCRFRDLLRITAATSLLIEPM